MLYLEILIFILLVSHFLYKIMKAGYLELDCWTITYSFLLIELYAIISYSISDTEVSITAFPLAICTMATAVLGYHISSKIHLKTNSKNSIDSTTALSQKHLCFQSISSVGLNVFLVIMILIGTFRYQGVPPVVDSFAALLKGGYSHSDAVNLTEARRMISKSHYFGGSYRGQGLTKTLQLTGWPLLCTTSLIIFLNNRKRKDLLRFLLFVLLGIIYLSGDGTRLPALVLILTCLIAFVQKRNVNMIKAFKYFFEILIFLIILSSLSVKQYSIFADGFSFNTLMDSIKGIIDRIFLGNTGCDILAINYISEGSIPVQNGQIHLHQVLNALPGISFSYMSFSYLLAQIAGASSTTYYSTTYLGIAYADFGFIGAMVSYFLVGSLCGLAKNNLSRNLEHSKSPIANALYSCLCWEIGYIVVRSLVAGLIDIAIIVGLYFLLKTLTKFRFIVGTRAKVIHQEH